LVALLSCSCFDVIALRPEFRSGAATHDALAISDALETLIDQQRDRPGDRAAAYDAVRQWPQRTAAYAYARAALTGRLAQIRGLTGASLIAQMERWTRYSLALDPDFRRGAAKRMLGTLYVIAPASLLEHGDSEDGLQMLEELLDRFPDDSENHLRVAEGYIALDDPEGAYAPLCHCLEHERELRPQSQRLLRELIGQIGGKAILECGG